MYDNMNKEDFLLESYKNTQELIRFTDSKVAVVLVIFGIQVGVFLDITKDYTLKTISPSLIEIIVFVIVILFVISIFYGLLIALIKVLKPNLAKNYSKTQYSLLYFEHIALDSKEVLIEKSNESKKEDIYNTGTSKNP